jgi:signal transduction histidine kinase
VGLISAGTGRSQFRDSRSSRESIPSTKRPLLLVTLGLASSLVFPGTAISVEKGDLHLRKQVLIVYENESTLPATAQIAEGIHQGLNAGLPAGFEVYSEYLDAVRFPAPDALRRLGANLAAKYADVPLDVVMPVGPLALRFVLDNRGGIAPGAPLIFGGISEDDRINNPGLFPGLSGVVSYFDVRKTIDLARRLQPEAKRAVVITGSAEFDHRWESSARDILGAYHSDLDVEYLTGLTLEEFKDRVRRLTPDVILLILTVFEDAAGKKFVPREVASQIAAASGAPAYAVYSSYIGMGLLGGYVETFESIGRDMAKLAGERLANPDSPPKILRSSGAPLVDWRQMKRWSIDVARLPEGAQVQFYEPTAWERYRPEIVGALAVVALQTATIVALIIQARWRRRTQQELALERLELAHLSRRTQLGELSGAFAHELNQPLTSILANAEAGAELLVREPLDTNELKEILRDIVEEDKRAAGVIAQLRQLMIKGEAKLDPMDLNDAVTATMALARGEMVARQTRLDFSREHSELSVRGNLVQLQQLILNLVMNSADAMSNMAPSERRIAIATRKRDDGFRELAVSDRGPGLSTELKEKVFNPFVSTKPKGLGLGLAICRSIALSHGGTLKFDDHINDGARVVLALPPL